MTVILFITCPDCGKVSWHPDDVASGYCGNCHDFTHGQVAEMEAR